MSTHSSKKTQKMKNEDIPGPVCSQAPILNCGA